MGNDFYQTLEEIILQKNDVAMGVGKGCHIEQAILDKDCRIGDNVTIIGDAQLANLETETYCIVEGIVVVKKGALIPSGSVIGKVVK